MDSDDNQHNNTITAISTPHGRGGISIIRLSGNDAIDIAKKIFRQKKELKTGYFIPRRQYFGEIVDENGDVIDEVLLSVAFQPNSFTGENTVEISCHGNPLIAEEIISLCRSHSARTALPGEFTKRSFLNGKIDLSKAEGVIDTINAKTAAALKLAKKSLTGSWSNKIEGLREEIIRLLAFLEAAIDYSEEDITFLGKDELLEALNSIINEFDLLIATFERGRMIRDGIKIAIVGAPNSGKSSLLNAMLGKDRAIVSEYAGTTRDTIDAEISLKGILSVIIDTAGIRHTEDPLESIGVQRSYKSIDEADFVIFVLDGTKEMDSDDLKLLGMLRDKPCMIAVNKSDLSVKTDLAGIENYQCISALTGQGIEEMIDKVIGQLNLHIDREEFLITTLFQKEQLQLAKQAAHDCIKELVQGKSEEFLAVHLTDCAAELAKITGADVSKELLNELFSRFCVGK